MTRRLIDIESITGNEAEVGEFLFQHLTALGWKVERMPVEERRFNLFATIAGKPAPELVFSTHIDTVPPFISSSEDVDKIYGRGACDTKGIIAAMIEAAGRLREKGKSVGLLLVVGEERDSTGAKAANPEAARIYAPKAGPRFLINGEPTESRVGVASKGSLRVEVVARGKMAHSAYPELGESAIEKLLVALERVKKVELPLHPEAGATTVNIGQIEGGRAPNVIPDYARAQLLYRTVGPTEKLIANIRAAVGDVAEVKVPLDIPFIKLRTVGGLPTFVAAYTTDIPALTNWGEPVLFGPGSIHVAHTDGEFIAKKEQREAVEGYVRMAEGLLGT